MFAAASVLGDRVRAAAQRHLAMAGAASEPVRAVAAVWTGLARPARPVALPAGCAVIGVSGATLGGSGVTPTVRAVAACVARTQGRVAVVSHTYRGRRCAPGWVEDDAASGDEAVEVRRALAADGVRVAVGAPRSASVAFAAAEADVIVVDGLLQTTPRRLALSLLVLEADEPWGRRRACPPAGDLRAAPARLLGAADAVVWLSPVGVEVPVPEGMTATARPVYPATSTVRICDGLGRPVDAASLRDVRCGLVVGVARPGRVRTTLARLGVPTASEIQLADHASARTFQAYELRAPRAGIDAWLTTAKCRTKMGARFAGAPVFTLTRDIHLPAALEHRLGTLSR